MALCDQKKVSGCSQFVGCKSALMLLELSANKAFFYAAYEGVKFVEMLEQQYLFVPKNVKDVYLLHLLSKMKEMKLRSVMIFASKGRTCRLLKLLLEELDQEAVEMHSLESPSLRLAALNSFKSRQVPCLIATDVASRRLDVPSVDLVINYDLPRDPSEYVHRVGRTARAGREGLAVSFVTEFENVPSKPDPNEITKLIDPQLGDDYPLVSVRQAVLPNWKFEFPKWVPSIVVILYDGRPEIREAIREQYFGSEGKVPIFNAMNVIQMN